MQATCGRAVVGANLSCCCLLAGLLHVSHEAIHALHDACTILEELGMRLCYGHEAVQEHVLFLNLPCVQAASQVQSGLLPSLLLRTS